MSRRTIKCYLNLPVIYQPVMSLCAFLHETPERHTCKECLIMQSRNINMRTSIDGNTSSNSHLSLSHARNSSVIPYRPDTLITF